MPMELLGPILIAVLGVVVLGAVIYFLLNRRKAKPSAPVPTTAVPVQPASSPQPTRREYRAAQQHSDGGSAVPVTYDAPSDGGSDGGGGSGD